MHGVNIKGKIAVLSVLSVMLMFASLVLPAFAGGIYIRGIDPPEGYPGMKVRVFGAGATPNGTVEALFSGPVNQTILIGNDTIPIAIINGNKTVGWTTADDMGYWEIIFSVPEVSPGNYTVYAVDNETLTSDAIGFGVLTAEVQIRISYVSPSAGPPGTDVHVNGDGATSGGEVGVYFDGMSVANTTAEEWRWWSTSFQVPNVASGNYTITALHVESNTTDTALFTVTPPPTVYVSPQEAAIGSKITINGEGFSTGTGIFLTFEDLLFYTPIYTDENGEFNATIFVPVVNSGNYTIKAVDTYYYPRALANVSFRVTMGLDTLFEKMDEVQNALNQTQSSAQSANDEASLANVAANSANDEALSAKEAAESALAMANEARIYALTTMIFAIITAALSATILIKRK